MVPFAVVGIVIWAVVGLALVPFRDTLAAHGHGDWLAICLAGFLWGFPGLAVMIRHDANRRRRRAAAGTAAGPTGAAPTGAAPTEAAPTEAAPETVAGADTEPGAPGPATVGPTTPA
jgi:hypothetical protein